MYISLSKYKTFEINIKMWNPFERMTFSIESSLQIQLKGDHSPSVFVYLCFVCVAFDIEFYDSRHAEEREK